MAAHRGAVDHVLPVVGQPKLHKRLEQRVPDALLGPAAEAHVDRVPLAIALVHVIPGAADAQDVEHPVEKAPVVMGQARLAAALGRQQHTDDCSFLVRQIGPEPRLSSKRPP